MLDCSTHDLAILRSVAQHGSFTAAAAELGYTQSAVSKRVAALEAAAGRRLFARERSGVRLTPAGDVVLRHAGTVFGALEAAERELSEPWEPGAAPVRLGAFASAIAGVVPGALERLRDPPVLLREGTSAALVRSLRAGTLDLALLASVPPFHPPDQRDPPLRAEVLAEGELVVAVGAAHRLAGRGEVHVGELSGERWVVARSGADDHRLGAWPGAEGAPEAPYVVRDWLSKLRLVARGLAVTTVPDVLLAALPPDIHTLKVRGGSTERRRLLLVHGSDHSRPEIDVVAAALRRAALANRP